MTIGNEHPNRATRRARTRRVVGATLASSSLVASGGAALVALTASPAGAATITVQNLADSGAGSLRQAIAVAAPGDTIDFAPGLTGTITLTSGQLVVDKSLVIQGPGAAALTVSGNDASRVFYLYESTAFLDITISGLTVADGAANIGAGIVNLDENVLLDGLVIEDNHATGDGGGVWSDGFAGVVEIEDTIISGNTSGDDGGGIYNEDTGALLSITRSTISGNRATDDGGGAYLYDPDFDVLVVDTTISGNTAGDRGGGVYLYHIDGGEPMTLRRTTISGNTAPNGSGAYLYNSVVAVFENSTISGNLGGTALVADGDTTLDLVQTTVTANAGSGVDGGDAGTVDAIGSIISANGGTNVVDSNILNSDHSLLGTTTNTTVNDLGSTVISSAPGLGPLANNGGLTRTHLPQAVSAAINAGPDPVPVFPENTVDQRGAGFARVVGARVDIGSVEVQPPTAPPPVPPPPAAVRCEGQVVTVDLSRGQSPTAGPDVIRGTPGNDVIGALGGDDVICGLGGDDTINSGPGLDRIFGGAGNDTVRTGAGGGLVSGGGGNDTLTGGTGSDSLRGRAGDDTLFGRAADDALHGGTGTDACDGGTGVDSAAACETVDRVP